MNRFRDAVARRLIRLSMVGFRRGFRLTRFTMYRELCRALSNEPKTGRVLSISHSRPLCDLLGFCGEIVEGNYPNIDMRHLPYDDNSFDFVVSDQVLEHIEGNPQDAIDESRRVIKAGGIAIHTSVTLYPVHGAPHDYWRFTPYGLLHLCKEFDEVMEQGAWGNIRALRYIELGIGGERVPIAPWHPVHRVASKYDDRWPITSWIVARK